MASKYWLKLYHEIIHDYKMGRLSRSLRYRVIEMFVLAGECDEGGYLPVIETIAWELRENTEQLESDLIELARVGILDQRNGRWFVVNFSKRQAPSPATERVQEFRKRQRNADETKCFTSNAQITDIDIDKITEEEVKARTPRPPTPVKIVPVNLQPETPQSVYIFQEWNKDRKGRGYGDAKKFGTLEQKQQTESALESMPQEEIEKAIKWALLNERTNRTALCNAIVKWADNLRNPKPSQNGHTSTRVSTPYERSKAALSEALQEMENE